MVSKMTNRLLALVMALAFSSGIIAHAAQDPATRQRTEPQLTLGERSNLQQVSLPQVLQRAAAKVSETAAAAIDPSAAIRAAYQRDHIALEHLRQSASQLKSPGHAAFNHLISEREVELTELERISLATRNPSATTAIAAMDKVVASTEGELAKALAQDDAVTSKTKTNGQSEKSQGSGR
jgi:hypothetical protein